MSLNGQLSKTQQDMLVEKWDRKKLKVSEISNANVARSTALVLENQYRYLVEAGQTLSTDVADFKKIVMPLVRRVWPQLLAHNIVAVQPMQGPVGLAYALRFKYASTVGSANAGDEMGYNTVHQDYSGTTSGATSGTGQATSAGELMGDGTNPSIPEAGLSIVQTTVTAKTRKLKSRWSLESTQDLKNMHGLDMEAELISMLQYEIAGEIDRELVNRIHGLCTVAHGNVSSVTVSSLDGRWEIEKYRNLYTRIVKDANDISTTTRRGPGNFIIASPNVITALDALGNFIIAPTNASPMELAPGVVKVGSIEGRFDVYRDTFATSDYAITGYHGGGSGDSGIIYSPYVPVLINKTMDPNSLYPVVGIMTRYAITDNLFGGDLYYKKLNIDFTGFMGL